MKKVIVGRPIEGISLNGLEYVLDDEGDIRYFDSIDNAKAFLRENGYDDKTMEDCLVFRESEDRTCFRCGSPLFKSDNPDYAYQCFRCDEDFYAFEQGTTPAEAMDTYERYKLEWMIAHGYSLQDLIRALTEYQYDDPEDSDRISTPINDLFAEWGHDAGFGSEIWACKDEWERTEQESKDGE